METVRMMKSVILLIILICEIIHGERGGRHPCPVPGGRNGVCVNYRKCAIPVFVRYFGRYWRRRGVVHLCGPPNTEEGYLVCCLRVIDSGDFDDQNVRDPPPWRNPENENSVWNGTEWIQDESDSRESERIVAEDAVYETKCVEYTQVAANVNNAISTGAPVIRTMIVGGTESLAKEFPHMALLGFGPEDSISWRCGGSLISDRFIMTAAHCLYTQDLGDVEFARLGDLDINSNSDEAQPQQFRIVQRFRHPAYNIASQYNDIALLQLESPVSYTKYVRPACLPSDKDLTNAQLIATGWGTLQYGGSTSSSLMKVDLQYYNLGQCQESFQPQIRLETGINADSQICAGGVNEQKDTCQGDSGGPLQIKTSDSPKMYEVVGITSFGKACGILNVPAVYTKVSYFVPWIEQIVWGNTMV